MRSHYLSSHEARKRLLEVLSPGMEVRTILRHVSSSRMTRWISPILLRAVDGEVTVLDLTGLVCDFLRIKPSDRHDGVEVGGCGMDMGFHLVYSLSSALWPKGYQCTGTEFEPGRWVGCPANDHMNNGYNGAEYGPGIQHNDGGYALTQRWL